MRVRGPCWPKWVLRNGPTTGLRSFPVVSGNAWHWRGALVHRPQLLLLDEPLGALDALTRIEMHALIERLWAVRHGFTALLVTHDVHEAVALGDRILLIEAGRIALDQPVPLARPRGRASASFSAIEEHVLQRVLQTAPGDNVASHDAYDVHADLPVVRTLPCDLPMSVGPSDPVALLFFRSTGANPS